METKWKIEITVEDCDPDAATNISCLKVIQQQIDAALLYAIQTADGSPSGFFSEIDLSCVSSVFDEESDCRVLASSEMYAWCNKDLTLKLQGSSEIDEHDILKLVGRDP